MKLVPGFDPERNSLIITLNVGFLDKYYSNLQGLLNMSENMPKGLNVVRTKKNEVEISFPLPSNATMENVREGVTAIGIQDDGGEIVNLHKALNIFINSGMRKELSTTEFIPLSGYPKEKIVEDIKESMKNKRNLCIIKDYAEYLKSQETKTYIFNQYIVNYGTSEWADLCLEILTPGFTLSKLQKKYSPMLKEINWL